ncbi:MAG TPA: hypothetical protein VF331_09925 [Polyangiales bacterium]
MSAPLGRFPFCACLLALGCAAPSFRPQFKPPVAPAQPVVLSELTRPKPRDERPVVVGVTTDPMRLCAWDLSAGLLWERPVSAKSAPLVVADAVVMQEAEGVVVRDLTSGEVRAVVDDKGSLVGADGQGHSVVVSVAYDTQNPRGAVAYVDGSGVRWKQPLNLPVGVPAISGEYVVVPWATQRLSVLAASDGRELGRYHYKDTVVAHALVDRGRLYAGQLGLLRVTETTLEHPEAKQSLYTPRKRELPGQPPLLRDGYLPIADPDNAYHRLQVSWRIGHSEAGPSTENDMLWLRFYRLLFALSATDDQIRWVRTFDHDLVGTAIQPGALFVVDSGGTLRLLDMGGATLFSRDLGRTLRVVDVRPGAWLPPMAAQGTSSATELPPPTLRQQLNAAAALDDDRLGAGRAYAVEHLAAFSEPDVTANLIALCAARKIPQPVQSAACAHLAERSSGAPDVVQALRQRASFLDDTPAPSVGPLAQAAAKMQLKQAGPLLVSHAEDPSTPARDLVALFTALEQLGQRSAAASIERFVRLHHAEPESSELGPALAAALHALGALHARAQRATLEDITTDTLTPPSTREQARAALALLDAPAAVAKADAPPSKPEEDEVEADETQTDPRPYSLTADVVRKALAPLHAELSKCVQAAGGGVRSGRVSLVVDGQGRVEGIFVLPATLQACVEPIVRNAKFPATRLGRQRLTHILHGPSATRASLRASRALAKKKK